jgi:aminoglycoside phosphotransferase
MDSFPIEILEYVYDLDYKIDSIGRSDDKVIVYGNKYILKISNDKDRLLNEKNKIDFLKNKLPVPKSICFIEDDDKYYYLRTSIVGESLISDRFINNPTLLIELISKAVKLLRKLDNIEIPFNSQENVGNSFVHGDLCLPNILVNDDNEIAGFIDLDNCGLGDPWYDYAWLLWSLEYNLKTNKYNDELLKSLGIEYKQEKYNQYIPAKYRLK